MQLKFIMWSLCAQVFMKEVVAALKANTDAWPFLVPVPRTEVPDYYDVIKVRIGSLSPPGHAVYTFNVDSS